MNDINLHDPELHDAHVQAYHDYKRYPRLTLETLDTLEWDIEKWKLQATIATNHAVWMLHALATAFPGDPLPEGTIVDDDLIKLFCQRAHNSVQ